MMKLPFCCCYYCFFFPFNDNKKKKKQILVFDLWVNRPTTVDLVTNGGVTYDPHCIPKLGHKWVMTHSEVTIPTVGSPQDLAVGLAGDLRWVKHESRWVKRDARWVTRPTTGSPLDPIVSLAGDPRWVTTHDGF